MRLCNNAIFVVLLAGAVLSLPAQQPPTQSSLAQAAVPTVLIPVTVVDPKGRLVISLVPDNFQVYENNIQQQIASLSTLDSPVSIGILFDLSGSMTSKLNPARESILRFIAACNPQDEFLVVGFNDHPELIENFTNSADDIRARLATVQTGKRTALSDSVNYALDKMKNAHYEKRALLVVSDGGDNASKLSENEVRTRARKSDVEIYAMGIFDPYAATPDERTRPQFLADLSESTGGRLIRVDEIDQIGHLAEQAAKELRYQYVIGYLSHDLTRDSKWRKVKVKVNPPQGLPPLTVHARTGYYAPLQ
jgi:Ca-activated chloride channel family protein